ncbi:MAG TPA: deoxyribose-phosphate aldolase [Microthrixaceae bacterium]|nr:deoxyribose-phosphate aldolase [Microthrixaceae bacterium]
MSPGAESPLLTRAELASRIDHTILSPEATRSRVELTAVEAVEFGCASVCVQPDHVAFVKHLVGDRIAVCSVVGFPHGANLARIKASEAAGAVAVGASEVDMVLGLGSISDGDFDQVRYEVATVREAVPDTVLKVIVESALWSDPMLREICDAAVGAGADFVKTSTGFHQTGGATVEAVKTMRETVGRRAMVKASGGIRTLQDARRMLDAGADRLGMSATAEVLASLPL